MKLKSVYEQIEEMIIEILDDNKNLMPLVNEMNKIDEIVSWQLWCNIRVRGRVEIFGKKN